jgi:hypothetical protein
MDHTQINLLSVQKQFTFERHARIIDSVDEDTAKEIAKCFLKLYLAQQETLAMITIPDGKQ